MPHIIPIKDLKNTSEVSELCHQEKEPIYVTKNGYGDMVIMSMEMYENFLQRMAAYQDIERSEEQVQHGQIKDAKLALAEMKVKYGV